VYYDPKNPESALLERDPPVPVGWLYTIAAAIFLGGLVVLAVFWNISAIFEGLSAYFPEKAFLPGMAFFTLGGLMLVAMLWMARRQVAEASGWPAIGGRIVKSGVEHYRKRVGGAQSGTLTTFYEPVVEYSYRVNDREYHSTQVSFGGKSASSQAIAEAAASRYPRATWCLCTTIRRTPRTPCLSSRSLSACRCWWWRSCSSGWQSSFRARLDKPARTFALRQTRTRINSYPLFDMKKGMSMCTACLAAGMSRRLVLGAGAAALAVAPLVGTAEAQPARAVDTPDAALTRLLEEIPAMSPAR